MQKRNVIASMHENLENAILWEKKNQHSCSAAIKTFSQNREWNPLRASKKARFTRKVFVTVLAKLIFKRMG